MQITKSPLVYALWAVVLTVGTALNSLDTADFATNRSLMSAIDETLLGKVRTEYVNARYALSL